MKTVCSRPEQMIEKTWHSEIHIEGGRGRERGRERVGGRERGREREGEGGRERS